MSDRCGGCGGWLIPEVDACPTCHRPVGPSAGARPSLADSPFELDFPAPPPARAAASLGPSSPLDSPLALVATEELLPEPELPRPRSRPARPAPVGEEEAQRRGAYGPAPAGVSGAVPYALRVHRRRQALYLEREALGARLVRAAAGSAEREAVSREIELCNRALEAFDAGRYRAGAGLLGVAFALVLTTLAWLIVR